MQGSNKTINSAHMKHQLNGPIWTHSSLKAHLKAMQNQMMAMKSVANLSSADSRDAMFLRTCSKIKKPPEFRSSSEPTGRL